MSLFLYLSHISLGSILIKNIVRKGGGGGGKIKYKMGGEPYRGLSIKRGDVQTLFTLVVITWVKVLPGV